jgi:hypothetical protein
VVVKTKIMPRDRALVTSNKVRAHQRFCEMHRRVACRDGCCTDCVESPSCRGGRYSARPYQTQCDGHRHPSDLLAHGQTLSAGHCRME